MADESVNKTSEKKPLNWKLTLAVCAAIVVVTFAAVKIIHSTEPTPQRSGATKRTAMLVEVIPVELGTYRPQIEAMGLVRAREDILLSPRVSGEILERSENFVPGSFIEQGEVLLKIDPADYQNAVAQSQSALNQAKADFQVEMGRQAVAKLDYELLDQDIAAGNEALILRQPQLDVAKANVEAAQAMLDQAKLALGRTTIRAPFDAQVLTRNVAVGSQVSPGDDLARLVGVESYWVTATVPLQQLHYIDFASEGNEESSPVSIRNRTAWGEGVHREGSVSKLIGALDEGTRLARVNVVIQDPLARQPEHEGKPPLIIGSLVEVIIQGRPIEGVVRINRDYLRKKDTVWVMEDRKLRIRPVTVYFRDSQFAYISEGLKNKDVIVTSGLSSVVEGAPLRVRGDNQESGQ